MAQKPELLLAWDANTGEGPVVDRDVLHWVDIPAGLIHRTNLRNLKTESLSLGVSIGAASTIDSVDGYAVAYENGFGIVENGKLVPKNPFLFAFRFDKTLNKCLMVYYLHNLPQSLL